MRGGVKSIKTLASSLVVRDSEAISSEFRLSAHVVHLVYKHSCGTPLVYNLRTLYPFIPPICYFPTPMLRTAQSSNRISLVVISYSSCDALTL